MACQINFSLENEAFKNGNAASAAAEVVRKIAYMIENGNVHDGISEPILDENGNSIGKWFIDYEVEDDDDDDDIGHDIDNAIQDGIDGKDDDDDVIAVCLIPKDFPVRILKPGEEPPGKATCGHCHLSWDDNIPTAYTPVPSGRCPFEYYHL